MGWYNWKQSKNQLNYDEAWEKMTDPSENLKNQDSAPLRLNVPYFLGCVMAVVPLVGVAYLLEYLARGSRRMAFQAMVQTLSGLLVYIFISNLMGDIGPLFWLIISGLMGYVSLMLFTGTIGALFYLIIPLAILYIVRARDWPNPDPLNNFPGARSIATIVFVLGLIGILAPISISQDIKYTQRERTAESRDHAKSICSAMFKWSSVVGEDGRPNSKLLQMRHNGVRFKERYPVEAKWLEDGDRFYQFVAHTDGIYGSSFDNPVVMASTKKGQKETEVYAEIIQAGGTGMKSGEDLAVCRTNVEVVSENY